MDLSLSIGSLLIVSLYSFSCLSDYFSVTGDKTEFGLNVVFEAIELVNILDVA